jgi:uncharacterized protein YecT (DUF1311 family)
MPFLGRGTVMRVTLGTCIGLCFCIFMPLFSFADICDDLQRYEDIAKCLGTELRESDNQINDVYKMLMGKLNTPAKTKLRNEQRDWLKARDVICDLDSKESNREKWLRAILADHKKTVCVTRFTRNRTQELDQILAKTEGRTLPPAPSPTLPLRDLQKKEQYEVYSNSRHSSGKWYYEVYLDREQIASKVEVTFSIGFEETRSNIGNLVHVRRNYRGPSITRLGLALDLDNGKYYSTWNGAWRNGAPGTAEGLDVKLGRTYTARIVSSVVLDDFLKHGLVRVNFGDRPFEYPLPPGYRPFIEKD